MDRIGPYAFFWPLATLEGGFDASAEGGSDLWKCLNAVGVFVRYDCNPTLLNHQVKGVFHTRGEAHS